MLLAPYFLFLVVFVTVHKSNSCACTVIIPVIFVCFVYDYGVYKNLSLGHSIMQELRKEFYGVKR